MRDIVVASARQTHVSLLVALGTLLPDILANLFYRIDPQSIRSVLSIFAKGFESCSDGGLTALFTYIVAKENKPPALDYSLVH